MKTLEDCPAAHSMDTTWFAVDDDGRVGVFDSGEAGAVPFAAALGMNPGADGIDTFYIDALRAARVLARSETKLDRVAPTPGQRVIVRIDASRAIDPKTYRESEVGALERSLGESVWVLRESDPRIVATTQPLAAAIPALAAADVLDEESLHEWLEEHADTGVFHFGNDDYDAAGEYVRHAAPADPIAADDLPTAIRDRVRAVVLEGAFADATRVQLADHFDPSELATWNDEQTLVAPTDEERAATDERIRLAATIAARTRRRIGIALGVAIAIAIVYAWLSR